MPSVPGLIVVAGGAAFAYSAIKGKNFSSVVRTLINGGDPASATATPAIGTGSAVTALPGAAPTVGGARGKAVAYAQAQLGKPYLFAAAGPNAFDCSGLTMMAWRAAGVNTLAHYTVTQYLQTKHIPYDQAQPGDIILVSTNKSMTALPHHVVLYIGGGNCIEAYNEGVPVRIAPVSEYNSQVTTVGQFPG